jgi:hypothetical protein
MQLPMSSVRPWLQWPHQFCSRPTTGRTRCQQPIGRRRCPTQACQVAGLRLWALVRPGRVCPRWRNSGRPQLLLGRGAGCRAWAARRRRVPGWQREARSSRARSAPDAVGVAAGALGASTPEEAAQVASKGRRRNDAHWKVEVQPSEAVCCSTDFRKCDKCM